jgi:hypothetical protein
MVDDRVVVGAVQRGAAQSCRARRVLRIAVGDRDEAHARMLGRKARAQRTDPARADDAQADRLHHSTLIPASLMTFDHCAICCFT